MQFLFYRIYLDNVQKPTHSHEIEALNCGWIHLDDYGKPFSKGVQTRIFRNKKGLRYHNKIHEQIQRNDLKKIAILNLQNELSIFHTGYSDSEYQRTGKLGRNIELLQKYLDEHPEDYNYWSYLGDSLNAKHRYDKAAAAYKLVLEHSSQVTIKGRLNSAAYNLLQILVDKRDITEEENVLGIVNFMYEHDRNINPDIIFQAGIWMFHRKQWVKALAYFEDALAKLDTYTGTDGVHMAGNLETVYYVAATAAQEAGFQQKAVNYCVKGLRASPHSERLLMPLLSMFRKDTNSQTSQVFNFLSGLYQLKELKEKLFVYKCAKAVSYFELEDLIQAIRC